MSGKTNQPEEYISRFKVIATLGEGGMGKVYKAHDPALDKTFALKVMNSSLFSEQYHLRFQEEAKTLKDLKHDAIPEIYNFAISSKGDPYLVMEYIEGKSLRQILEENDSLDLDYILSISIQICDALAYAHKNRVIHRDIKPDNIIISEDAESGTPKVKLIDFGISKLEDKIHQGQDMTKSGVIVGSPFYINPEQIRGQSSTARSDIYSLGCVLFEMLAGNPPYMGNNALNTLSKHLEVPVDDALKLLPEDMQNSEIARIVKTALAKKPEERFQSAEELKRHLIQYQTEQTDSQDDDNYIPLFEEEEPETTIPLNDASLLNQSKKKPVWPIVLTSAAVISAVMIAIFINLKPPEKTKVKNEKYNPKENLFEFVSSKYLGRGKPGDWQYNASSKDWIAGENVTDEDFKKLANKKLKKNVIIRCDFSDKVTGSGVKYFKDLPIERLVVASKILNDDALVYAGKIKSLKMLTVGYTDKLTPNGFRQLAKNQNIEKIALKNMRLPDGCIEELSKMKNLISVRLEGSTNVNRSQLIALQKIHKLTSLYLAGADIKKGDLEVLGNLKNIYEIGVQSLNLHDSDIEFLKRLDPVKINLGTNQITDISIIELSKNKKLKELIINHYKTSRQLLKVLEKRNIKLTVDQRPATHES